ncbi:MAG: hypothetical protein K0A90_04385 [Methanosarcinaceae archaeon]|nr:hypothetical protein [Methanosarcinaceae archaeon]
MTPITQIYSNPPILPCEAQCATVLNMTAGTHYILLGLALVIGFSMLFLYLKINSSIARSSAELEKISDLFDTLE